MPEAPEAPEAPASAGAGRSPAPHHRDTVPYTGPAAAAVLAAGFGLLALGGTNVMATAFQPLEEALSVASRLFFPGGDQVVAYGGKELVGLVVWLSSWAVLHFTLRYRPVTLTGTAAIFLVCLVGATLLFWPPIITGVARLARW